MTQLLRVAVAAAVLAVVSGCTNTPGDVYGPCKTECTDIDLACFTVDIPSAKTLGGVCSRNCDKDEDCPGNFGFAGACYAIEGNKRICYQRCTTDTDCYTQSVCVRLTLASGGVDYVCAPTF